METILFLKATYQSSNVIFPSEISSPQTSKDKMKGGEIKRSVLLTSTSYGCGERERFRGKLGALGSNGYFGVLWILRTFLSVPISLSVTVHLLFPMTDLGFFCQFST